MAGNRYYDTTSAIQVIGCVYKQPSLLEDEGTYFFTEEDFTNDFHRVIFGSMRNLYLMGTTSFSIKIIEDYLKDKPESLATYKSGNGANWLKEQEDFADLANFRYYYSRLKKFTLLREYDRFGLNVKWIYDPDEIFDAKKRESQEKYLDSLTLEEIAASIETKIEGIRRTYIDNSEDNSYHIGNNIDNLIEELKKEPEVGPPMYGTLVNTITRGMRLGKLFLRSAATGVGKALPNSTIVPTPDGDKRVDEIKEGDFLFDAFGKPTKVLKVYPQGKKEVWEVTFKDGRKAKCCDEHLWSYCTKGQKPASKKARKFDTHTVKEMLEKHALYTKSQGYHYLVPMQQAVQYPTKKYYIKPYSFGLLLGDGSFRYNESQKALNYSSEDEQLPSAIAEEMNWEYHKNSQYNYNWTFKWKEVEDRHVNVWVEEALCDYPELWNTKSEDKFIPKEYLEGDIQQRLDLLNGLLDSDGSVDEVKGRVGFWTASPRLRDDIVKLCQSLGFKVTWFEDNHKDTLSMYVLDIMGKPEDKVKLFKLPRKKERIEQWFNNGKRKEHNDFNPIVDIQNLGYEEEMTCFYVDNDEHLFLMNDYIVTHNTRTMVADACYCACDEIYDTDRGQWVSNGLRQPALYIATEQELDEIQTIALAFLAGVDEEHILTGEYNFNEEERVKYAAKVLQNAPLYVEYIPDFTLKDIENCIKRHIRQHSTQYIFYDYVHTSMRMLEDISKRSGGVRLREDNLLFLLSVKLKDICTQFNVFILTSTQLNQGWKTDDIPDQNLLRGAKAIADKSDVGFILLDTTEEDKEALQELLEAQGYPMPNVKLSVYKNRRGSYNKGYLWMTADKSTCRFNGIFYTDYRYNQIHIGESNIIVSLD